MGMNTHMLQKVAVPQLSSQILPQRDVSEGLRGIQHQSVAFCASLGYDYVAYTGYFPVGGHTHDFCNFPEHFAYSSNSDRMHLKDLVYKQSQNRTSPYRWSDISTASNDDSTQLKRLLGEVQDNDIYNGICIPIHGAGAEQGMLNVAHNNKTDVAAEDSLLLLQFYAMGVHEAVKHYHEHNMKGLSKMKSLSPRERECLDWIAAGKTAWETAIIVGITESTVTFHIRNTIQKLNASNRAHAVAIAMACSLISNAPQ